MNEVLADHPAGERLAAFRRGALSEDEWLAIEAHLSTCATCCEMLRSLPDDSLLDLVRQAVDLPTAADASGTPSAPFETESQTRDQGTAVPVDEVKVPPELAAHPRYRILEILDGGGMSLLFKAEHCRMKRTVALKIIHPQLVSSESAIERFHREVQAAARLDHRNIVTAHDADQAGDVHFLVMEFVQGTDLAKVVKKRGPLPVDDACAYVRQAALGLQHARENGMVHRDIKPQNLMLTSAGHVKIVDFGLASFACEAVPISNVEAQLSSEVAKTDITHTGIWIGTPDYMAPEMARNPHTADIRADIYSLGCTLYFILTGQVPFPGGTVSDKINAHAKRPPQPVSDLRPGMPPRLVGVVEKMMAKDLAERYQTPADVADALAPWAEPGSPDEHAQGEPGPGRARSQPINGRQIERPWSARRKWRRLGLSAAVTLFATILALATWFVYYSVTDNGRIEIRTDDDNIKIVAEGNGTQVILDPRSKQTWVMGTGEWTVRLDGNPEGLEIDLPHTFTLKRDETRVVTVKRVKVGIPEPFLGSWKVVRAPLGMRSDDIITITRNFIEIKGKAIKSRLPLSLTKDSIAILDQEGNHTVATLKLDSAQKPAQFDVTWEDKTYLGIFEIRGDRLRICAALPVDPRPRAFEGEMLELQRVPPPKKD